MRSPALNDQLFTNLVEGVTSRRDGVTLGGHPTAFAVREDPVTRALLHGFSYMTPADTSSNPQYMNRVTPATHGVGQLIAALKDRDPDLDYLRMMSILQVREAQRAGVYRAFSADGFPPKMERLPLGDTGLSMIGLCDNGEVSMAVMRVVRETLLGKSNILVRSDDRKFKSDRRGSKGEFVVFSPDTEACRFISFGVFRGSALFPELEKSHQTAVSIRREFLGS